MSLSNKEATLKYADIIRDVTTAIRREITNRKNELSTTNEKLLALCEDFFFIGNYASEVGTMDIRVVIMAIYRRVRSKYGILRELLDDPEINEIMINGASDIYVERRRMLELVDDAFISEEELEETIRMFASDIHREINEANPIVDARLPNGYRVNGVLKAVALNGPILTIRKFSDGELTLDILVQYGSLTEECASNLRELVKSGYNIFISGGTSSGKTTFLNALAMSIDKDERVIIIEDSAELKLTNIRNKVHMECRSANSIGKGEVSMQQLIKTSLRMRPDRIIVGEVRGKEIVDMIQAMNTGHDGSMSTGHGNSIKGMLNRLESLYLMDSRIPMYSVKSQIANAIDIFVHLRRDASGRRRVVEVAELVGYDGEDYMLNYLYVTDDSGELTRTGNELSDDSKLRMRGYS